jgi:predicted component of type VI protein secretion system
MPRVYIPDQLVLSLTTDIRTLGLTPNQVVARYEPRITRHVNREVAWDETSRKFYADFVNEIDAVHFKLRIS